MKEKCNRQKHGWIFIWPKCEEEILSILAKVDTSWEYGGRFDNSRFFKCVIQYVVGALLKSKC